MNSPICAHDVPRSQACAPCAGVECHCEVCDRDCKPAELDRWRGGDSFICLPCQAFHEAELAAAVALGREEGARMLEVDDGLITTCSVAEFLRDNADGLCEGDEAKIVALLVGESVRFGGGAAPVVSVRRTA